MAVLGLCLCARAFSSCGKRGPLFIVVRRPLLLRSTGSRRAGSVTVAHGPSCSAACGIFPDQALNPCPLHWQADSQPLRHQGSPHTLCFWCHSLHLHVYPFTDYCSYTWFYNFFCFSRCTSLFKWLSLSLPYIFAFTNGIFSFLYT